MTWFRTVHVVHEIDEEGALYELLSGTRGAIDKLGDALLRNEDKTKEVLTAINNLTGKVDKMSSNIDRIEKEAADMAENVGLIRTAIEELRSTSEAMKTEIASLKEQVAQGQLDQARLDAAAATFEKADDDIDSIVLPGTPPAPPEG